MKNQSDDILVYAESLMRWAKNFAKSRPGKQIMFMASQKYFRSERKVKIFADRYLNFKPGGYGCHAHLYVTENGFLEYVECYKWMGSINQRVFKTAEELATTLHPEFIKAVCEAIASREVFKNMLDEIKD